MKNINIYLKKLLGLFILVALPYLYWTEFRERDWQYVTLADEELKKHYTDKKLVLKLYQLMKDFDEILGKNDIKYWIEGGTLLGAVRNEGIIKFDDDLDIDIMREDEIKFQDLIPEFEKLGYSINQQYIYIICHKHKHPCLDVFVTHRRGDKTTYSSIPIRNTFPNSFFNMNELFPLKKYKFGNIEVYGPKSAKPYLDRQYPEWDKYAVIQQKHTDFLYVLGINKIKFTLTPELLKPAEPLGPLEDRVIR